VQSHFLSLFEKVKKSVIAQSLFQNKRMCKNVQKFFSKCEKNAILKFALFSHIFAHSLILKERLCDHTFLRSHNLSLLKNVRSHILSLFKMCKYAIALFFALFKCATKCAIAQSLFWKEWMWKKCADFKVALFSHVKKSDRTFSKCGIAQPCIPSLIICNYIFVTVSLIMCNSIFKTVF